MPTGVYPHKPRSEETKRKIGASNRIALRGRKLSGEHRKKISEYNKRIGRMPPDPTGRKFSQETKDKISRALTGIRRNNEHLRGANNHNWRGGTTPERTKIWKSREYQEWRTAVFTRDNYTCQDCGTSSAVGNPVTLNADHIKPFALHPELRFKVNNGRTLCLPCHRKTPTYGWRLSNIIRWKNSPTQQELSALIDGHLREFVYKPK